MPRPLLLEFIRDCCTDDAVQSCAVDWLQQAVAHADSPEPDYLSALHVLLPGLEWIVRLLVRPTSTSARRESTSSIVVGLLPDLQTTLREWQHTSVVPGVPDFFVEHMLLLLVDPHGKQLRARVEHGLLSEDHHQGRTINPLLLSFFSVLHAYLLCCLLMRGNPQADVPQATVMDIPLQAVFDAIDAKADEEMRALLHAG